MSAPRSGPSGGHPGPPEYRFHHSPAPRRGLQTRLGGRLLSRGHDKARLVPRDHDCGCDAPPPRLGPGGGGIRAGLIAAAGGRRRARGARAVRCRHRGRASCLTGAAWRRSTGWPGTPKTKAVRRRWARPALPSGVAQGLSRRTRLGGEGQGRRRDASRRPRSSTLSRPGGRVPGRRQAVTNAGEGPSQRTRGKEPERWS